MTDAPFAEPEILMRVALHEKKTEIMLQRDKAGRFTAAAYAGMISALIAMMAKEFNMTKPQAWLLLTQFYDVDIMKHAQRPQ